MLMLIEYDGHEVRMFSIFNSLKIPQNILFQRIQKIPSGVRDSIGMIWIKCLHVVSADLWAMAEDLPLLLFFVTVKSVMHSTYFP